MINLIVERKYKKADYTIGRLWVNGISFCDTLEDTDRGLSDDMDITELLFKKVYGKTAIPSGTYIVKLTYSPKFYSRSWGAKYRGLVPEIFNVKAYSGVRIHPANKAEEILGCIAIGVNKKKGMVLDSVKWYRELMDDFLYPAHERGETITITIK